MLRSNITISRDLRTLRVLYLIFLVISIAVQLNAKPTIPLISDPPKNTTDNSTETSSDNDLYVVKAVVYEIGILTDTDNSTDGSSETQQEVDISFYDRSTSKNLSSPLTVTPIALLLDARNLTS